MTLDGVLSAIAEHHFPNPPALMSDIDATENRLGRALPDDMRTLYLKMNGASLFSRQNAPFRIMRLDEICRARLALFGSDEHEDGPESWFAFCELPDTNFVGIELTKDYPSVPKIRDCNHAGFPEEEYCGVIAGSFTEFVDCALNSRGEVLFWIRQE